MLVIAKNGGKLTTTNDELISILDDVDRMKSDGKPTGRILRYLRAEYDCFENLPDWWIIEEFKLEPEEVMLP